MMNMVYQKEEEKQVEAGSRGRRASKQSQPVSDGGSSGVCI